MGVSFFERMSGRLADDEGGGHFVDFDIKCETTHLSALLRTG